MSMALKVEEMYDRIYVDCQKKLFCYTLVPLSRATHPEIVADRASLRQLRRTLIAKGYTQAVRQAFQMLTV